MIVARALEGLPGVDKAVVTFRPPVARITYDPTRVTIEQMVEAVRRAGFDAAPLKEP
ncbi:MAG: cation transporter [Candidatus Methylomirabilales bacterium]